MQLLVKYVVQQYVYAGDVQFDEFDHLRLNHPSWVLLRASNAPLILSFLGRVFVDDNAGAVSAPVLIDALDEEIYALNQRLGQGTFPRKASEYLDDWAAADRGWLRKFYPPASDEPHYDLSPAVEKAVAWVRDLRAREFVGTESRLNTAFELLRQMVYGADEDPERRLIELRRRRAELDDEIAKVERGDITILDAVSQRDRYQQFSRTARELLSDFREVEENFRRLDRKLREQIAGWTGSKGELLDEVLGNRNGIAESDQGRSFQAFYDFLLSFQKQAELTDLLERLQLIEHLTDQDQRLAHIHFDWIDASERTQATVRLLSEQLRRFLDDQVWLENRRVFDLLRSIESQALELRNADEANISMTIDDTSMTVNLPFERPLYRPPHNTPINSASVEHGDGDFDSSALHGQLYVDRDELLRTVRQALRRRSQIGLGELVEETPLQQGLAELIGYFTLSDPTFAVVFDDDNREQIEWDAEESARLAEVPQVTFSSVKKEAP